MIFLAFAFMKIKQQPQDFRVEELPAVIWSQEKAAHAVYTLEKQEVDTITTIRMLARRLRLPNAEIGYAGLKDKHALSIQYITLPTHCNIETMRLPGIQIKRVGYLSTKIQVGDLQANTFTITIRDLHTADLEHFNDQLDSLRADGVPNYFDSQRFGSVIDHVFIAKLLIQGNNEAAVKQYLTAFQKSEPKSIKDDKRTLAANWAHLTETQVRDKTLARIIEEYRTTHDWLQAYQRIPSQIREIHANAYQSYLWNETLKELLNTIVDRKRLFTVEYAAGSLLFYRDLTADERQAIPPELYTPSETALYSGKELTAVKRILAREGISQQDLAKLSKAGYVLKARPRPTIVTPTGLSATIPQPDELNTKPNEPRSKIQLTFTLLKGVYATIVTKRLFGH